MVISSHIKEKKLYEGKAKILYATDDESVLIQVFKNSATAFNGLKKAEIDQKAETNLKISSFLFQELARSQIKTHLLEVLDERSQKIMRLKMIPLEVVVRNKVAGSLAKKTSKAEGEILDSVLVEFYLKDDAKGDPQLTEDQAAEYLDAQTSLEQIKKVALQINEILKAVFAKLRLDLIDFKLEFGMSTKGELILGDEISPDTCRIWDLDSGEKLDKDRFRFDLGDLMEGYKEVWERLNTLNIK